MEKLKPFKTLLFIYDLWGWKASMPHVCPRGWVLGSDSVLGLGSTPFHPL